MTLGIAMSKLIDENDLEDPDRYRIDSDKLDKRKTII